MRREFQWNGWLCQLDAPLVAKRRERCQCEQGKKTKRRFQDENNGKVKPNAVGIPVPEKEGRSASANEDERYATEIQQRRHEQAPEEQRSGAMPEAFESARGLIPGKNKVEGVNGQGSPEDSQKGGPPPRLAPDARIRFGGRLTWETTPARAQSKGGKDKK